MLGSSSIMVEHLTYYHTVEVSSLTATDGAMRENAEKCLWYMPGYEITHVKYL
jgi:hypothetical protein